VFARESGLVKKGQLSEAGLAFYQTQDSEILLEAFEIWTKEGHFDELSAFRKGAAQCSIYYLPAPS
jgi:hypothetical protein